MLQLTQLAAPGRTINFPKLPSLCPRAATPDRCMKIIIFTMFTDYRIAFPIAQNWSLLQLKKQNNNRIESVYIFATNRRREFSDLNWHISLVFVWRTAFRRLYNCRFCFVQFQCRPVAVLAGNSKPNNLQTVRPFGMGNDL